MKQITNYELFQCPECSIGLIRSENSLLCQSCKSKYLIDDYGVNFLETSRTDYFHSDQGRGQKKSLFRKFDRSKHAVRDFLFGAPNITVKNVDFLIHKCELDQPHCLSAPKNVLIIGVGDGGAGVRRIIDLPENHVFGLDVAAGELVNVRADALQLPFNDKSFDLVIIQAVLEHIIEPKHAVNEIKRVLRQGGIIYAETPFMQPVHEGVYDYQRFTLTGHRYLMKDFARLKSGSMGGATLAISWLLKAAFQKAFGKASVILWLPLAFILKLVDLILYRKGDNIGMCGVFFIGELSVAVQGNLDGELADAFLDT